MKKLSILLSLFFLTIFFQNQLLGQKNGIEINLLQMRYLSAQQINEPIFNSSEVRGMFSFNPEAIFSWTKNKFVRFNVGIGMTHIHYSLKGGRINIQNFSDRGHFDWNVSEEHKKYFVKKLIYENNYLRILIGARFYVDPNEKWARLTFSTRLESLILLKSEPDLYIAKADTVPIFFEIISRIPDTVYEGDAEEFFKGHSDKILLCLRIGLGIDWVAKEKFSFGHELSIVKYFNSINSTFLKNPGGIGITASFNFLF